MNTGSTICKTGTNSKTLSCELSKTRQKRHLVLGKFQYTLASLLLKPLLRSLHIARIGLYQETLLGHWSIYTLLRDIKEIKPSDIITGQHGDLPRFSEGKVHPVSRLLGSSFLTLPFSSRDAQSQQPRALMSQGNTHSAPSLPWRSLV